MIEKLAPCITFAACLAACGGATMGPEVRTDIIAQVQAAQPPIQTCYQRALDEHKKVKGIMVLQLAAAPGTGQFVDISVKHDELSDPVIKKCVVDALSKLKLTKPPEARIEIPSLPIHFAWK